MSVNRYIIDRMQSIPVVSLACWDELLEGGPKLFTGHPLSKSHARRKVLGV